MVVDLHLDQYRRHPEASRVLQQYGRWFVTTYGVETLAGNYLYAIEKRRVYEPWWVSHVGRKTWGREVAADLALALADAKARWPKPRKAVA